MATIFDVAKDAGVSAATVSRVINNSLLVTEEKRNRVIESMNKVGYIPPIRDAKPDTGKLIAVITSVAHNDTMSAMRSAAADHGYGTVFIITGDVQDDTKDSLNTLKFLHSSGQLVGIVLNSFYDKASKDLFKLIHKYPVVQVGEAHDFEENYLVATDDYQAAYDAVNHLIDTGRKRIALFITRNHDSKMNFELQRMRGYRSALMDHGMPVEDELFRYSDFTTEGAAYATEKFLDKMQNLPDSVICMNDYMAYGCVGALLKKGLKVPEDISVIGFDDVQGSLYYNPPLTTIAQDFETIGKESIKLLHSVIIGEIKGGRKLLIPHKLIVRESTVKAEG